MSQKSKFF